MVSIHRTSHPILSYNLWISKKMMNLISMRRRWGRRVYLLNLRIKYVMVYRYNMIMIKCSIAQILRPTYRYLKMDIKLVLYMKWLQKWSINSNVHAILVYSVVRFLIWRRLTWRYIMYILVGLYEFKIQWFSLFFQYYIHTIS